MGLDADVAVIRATLEGHLENDKAVQAEIRGTMARIENLLTASIDKQERAVARIHERIDGEATVARDGLKKVDDKVNDQKVWLLTNAIAAMGAVGTAAWAWITTGKGHP